MKVGPPLVRPGAAAGTAVSASGRHRKNTEVLQFKDMPVPMASAMALQGFLWGNGPHIVRCGHIEEKPAV